MAKRDSLKRRRAFRTPLPRILIVCEGTKTEPGYFNDLRQSYRSVVQLELSPGGVPKTLIARAVEMKQGAEKLAKVAKDDNVLYDEVWCVFDVDDHPRLNEVMQQARDNRVKLAISNPCFELWVLLHFQDQRAHINRTALRAECRKYLPAYKKDLPMDLLTPNYPQAAERATRLEAWQRQQGRGHANPSTGIHNLTENIRGRTIS